MPSDPFRSTASPRSCDGSGNDRPLRSVPTIDAEEPLPATALRFSETVRTVIALARRGRLRPPVFRSPPGLAQVDRSIRRRPNGTVVVAVRRAGRPLAAVQADVIEGVVVANELDRERADHFRRAAWDQLAGTATPATDPPVRSARADRRTPPARPDRHTPPASRVA